MRLTFTFGKAGKWDGKPIHGSEFENGRYGWNWFVWLPHVRWNGGRPWKRECMDVVFDWFCFWFGFTIWSK